MLDIKEIERRLKDDIEVKLECVDTLGFTKDHNDANREILDSSLFVESVDSGSIYIKGCGYNIIKSEYKFFRIKEESPHIEDNPTFNDLIVVAVQGVKDNVIFMDSFCVDNIRFESVVSAEDDSTFDIYYGDSSEVVANAINFINSLYTETFVIEREEDLKRVKAGSKIKLLNDRLITVREVGNYGVYFEEDGCNGSIGSFILKGATVTQKRGW